MGASLHPEHFVAVGIFSLWAMGIVALQLNILIGLTCKVNLKWLTFWKRYDLLNLCPNLAFFSRLPTVEYQLLSRDRLCDGTWASWRLLQSPRHDLRWTLWNPHRRAHFALDDACRELVFHVRRQFEGDVPPNLHCAAFLYLLHYTALQPRSCLTQARQFMVTSSNRDGLFRPLFISPLFRPDLSRVSAEVMRRMP